MENKSFKVEKQKIIWIDKNIKKEEKLKKEFINLSEILYQYKIFKASSVKEAFKIIEEQQDKNKFELLFYVIVSGELSELFFSQYVINCFNYHFIAATIVYCSKEYKKLLEIQPFYLDPFLNPGGIVDSFDFIS